MRYIYRLVFVLCCVPFSVRTLSAAEPYTAVITADGVAVRSGPGVEFYPTLQLHTGDQVEVFYEQSEWCAIRPPIGSFSWVSAQYINFGIGNIGTVLADGLASRIGSNDSDDCETVQVTLKRGESVFILERRETPENPVSPIWLKIAPPSGEFRWIHRSALQSSVRQVRYDAAPAEAGATKISALPKVASAHPFSTMQGATTSTSVIDPFQRAFNELQREAYIVMTRPTDDEVFAVLLQRAEELHQIAPTDLDLEKTYHLLESLQRTREVRRVLAQRRPAMTKANQNPFAPNSFAQNPRPAANSGTPAPQQSVIPAYTPTSVQSGSVRLRAGVNIGGYDIVGRLGEFDPLPHGHPPYAVVDEKEQIICLISPSAHLDLSSYIGQFVGINGILGEYHRQQGKPPARHITARNIQTLQ